MLVDRPNPSIYTREPLHKGVDLPPEVDAILENPKYGWIKESLNILMLNPSLSITRQYFSDALWRMYNQNEQIKEESDFDDDDIYNHVTYLEAVLTVFGLASTKELKQMKPSGGKTGKSLAPIDASCKYKAYDELKELTQELQRQGKTIGIIHGCFDPTQLGHAHMASEAYPYSDIVLCGFQRSSQIKEVKGTDRPRFPELAWRMWEMASLPSIDYCFVLPVSAYHAPEEEFTQMYQELGVKVMSTGPNNPLLPIYESRMQRLGGKVIANKYRWDTHSSTLVVKHIANNESHAADVPRIILQAQVGLLDTHARRCGYLRDFPNGT